MSTSKEGDSRPYPLNPRNSGSALRRQGMKMSLVESCFSHVHLTLTGPHFLTGFLLMLGATDWHLGLLFGLPHFLQILQIVSAYITSHFGSRKLICCTGVVLYRGVHVLMALLPFLPGLTMEERMLAIFALFVISNAALMFVANAWSAWMADLVPVRIRGRFFGLRSGLALVYNTAWSLIGAAVLDYYKSTGEQAFGFLVLFALASAFAMVGLIFLRRQHEPVLAPEPHPSPVKVLGILRDSNFRNACLYYLIFNFGLGLSAAFYSKHMLGYMGMTFMLVMLYPVIVNVVGFLCAQRWGRLMDAVGTRTTLLICSTVVGFLPLIWLFAVPGVLWPIWLDAVATGVFWTGLAVATTNLPLIITPEKHKMHFLGLLTTIGGLGIGSAALLSGKLAMALTNVKIHVPGLGHEIVNYHIMFAISTVFRLAGLFFLLRVQEARGRSISGAFVWVRERVSVALSRQEPVVGAMAE